MSECENSQASWLNKTFIETVLCNNNDSLFVDEVHVSAAVDKGVNYASELLRVAVDCHHDATSHFRRHLMVKSLPQSEVVRELLTECGTFERETRMYEKTLPDLKEILGATSGGFAANSYPCGRPHTIIMEDLTAKGYKMVDSRCDGLDFDHCKLVLLALARMHAASLIYCKHNAQVVDDYKEKFYTPEFLPMTTAIFDPMFMKLIAEVATWPGYESYASKLRSSLTIANIIDVVKHRAGDSLVLNHGDPWINNMLFRYEDEHGDAVNHASSVKLVDFQETRLGSPALDLQFFYATSPSVHVRETRWTELVGIYHTEYCNIIQHAGEGDLILDDVKTVDALMSAISSKALFGLMTASITLPLVFLDADAALDIDKVVRTEVDDGDDKVGNMYMTARFMEAFKKLLVHYDEMIWSN